MTMRTKSWLSLLVGIAALAISGSAHASLVQALDLKTLVAKADQVVLARAVSETSHYDDNGNIITDTTLQVEQSIKGDQAAGSAVVVRRMGGEVDGVGMRVAGEASFAMGETVLLFGKRTRAGGVLRSLGMSQGTLRISERDGSRWARSNAGDAAAVERDGRGGLKSAGLAVPSPRKLDELITEIRALLPGQR